jgi:hypothetical protein
MKNLILPTVAALVIVTLALTVWITRYRYVHGNGMNGVPYVLRVDRWTGQVMRLNFNAGWYNPKICATIAKEKSGLFKDLGRPVASPGGFDWSKHGGVEVSDLKSHNCPE